MRSFIVQMRRGSPKHRDWARVRNAIVAHLPDTNVVDYGIRVAISIGIRVNIYGGHQCTYPVWDTAHILR